MENTHICITTILLPQTKFKVGRNTKQNAVYIDYRQFEYSLKKFENSFLLKVKFSEAPIIIITKWWNVSYRVMFCSVLYSVDWASSHTFHWIFSISRLHYSILFASVKRNKHLSHKRLATRQRGISIYYIFWV